MIIDAISDLHGYFPKLEGGDLLIIGGDLTKSDRQEQYEEFFEWLAWQEYKKKIFICGNHDNLAMSQFDWYDAEYLYDTGTEYEGLKIWGSAWTTSFTGMNKRCMAYTKKTDAELNQFWKLIPEDIDILVTHSPPYGVLDQTYKGINVGSNSLASRINTIRPKYHIFGHIHEQGGKFLPIPMNEEKTTIFANVSYVNDLYQPIHKPFRIIL